eukprot:GGOE01020395.1.p2 GENE.GGOE01020395.1~~GGOE01020395.1.p2  ORF type:complete len:422 (+),score=134.84 GGOE01020395.1:86-1351(+)
MYMGSLPAGKDGERGEAVVSENSDTVTRQHAPECVVQHSLPEDIGSLRRHVIAQEEAIQELIHEVAEEREHNRLLAESIPMLQASIQKEVEGLAAENTALHTELQGLRALRVQLERENVEAGKAVVDLKAEVTRLRTLCGDRNSVEVKMGSGKLRVDIAELDVDPETPPLATEVARLMEERVHIDEEMGVLRQALDEVTTQMAGMQKKATEQAASKPKDKCLLHEATIKSLKKELMATARENERLRCNGMQDRDRRGAAEKKAATLEHELHAQREAVQSQKARAEALLAELKALQSQPQPSPVDPAEVEALREEVSQLTALLEAQERRRLEEAAVQAAAIPAMEVPPLQESVTEAGEGGECVGYAIEAERPLPTTGGRRLLIDPAQQPLPCLNCGSALYATGRFCSRTGHSPFSRPRGRLA